MSQRSSFLPLSLVLAASFALPQSTARPGYDIDYIGPPLADPVLQHSKETYVLFGCSYCHGLNLVVRGEATDLMHSRLVGRDRNGDLIGPLLRSGIPQTAKLSPMPQFSDLSDQQIGDLVRWIHYARQQGRYKELVDRKDLRAGNAAAGKVYFDQTCGSCHSTTGDFAKLARKYDADSLRAQIVHPESLDAAPSWRIGTLHDARATAARQRHLELQENYTAEELANLMVFLESSTSRSSRE